MAASCRPWRPGRRRTPPPPTTGRRGGSTSSFREARRTGKGGRMRAGKSPWTRPTQTPRASPAMRKLTRPVRLPYSPTATFRFLSNCLQTSSRITAVPAPKPLRSPCVPPPPSPACGRSSPASRSASPPRSPSATFPPREQFTPTRRGRAPSLPRPVGAQLRPPLRPPRPPRLPPAPPPPSSCRRASPPTRPRPPSPPGSLSPRPPPPTPRPPISPPRPPRCARCSPSCPTSFSRACWTR